MTTHGNYARRTYASRKVPYMRPSGRDLVCAYGFHIAKWKFTHILRAIEFAAVAYSG